MSLAGMDLGPKMDCTLDNGLYQRFKVFKERCIDIIISQRIAEGKITDDEEEVTFKKKLRTYWQLFKDNTKPRSNSFFAVVELKRLFQSSMTLEPFVTKATILVDEARHPSRHKDRMVHDTLIAGISNDIV